MRLVLAVLLALAVTACKKSEAPVAAQAPAAAAGAPAAGAGGVRGKVVERIDAAPYSYLKIQGPTGEIWAAVPQVAVEKGADVVIENPMPMDGFESKTLNRKFEKIYFGTLGGQGGAPQAAAPGAAGGMPGMPPGGMPPAGGAMGAPPPGMAAQHAAAAAGPADVGDVKVAKATGPNAKTVAEIYGQKAQLKEKKVTVKGKVVKANSGIMGKNWLHVRDGSGTAEKADNDITITTDGTAAVGDVVVITGVVRVDKDFGAGYAYPVIIEEATVAK